MDLVMVRLDILVRLDDADELREWLTDALGHFERSALQVSSCVGTPDPEVLTRPDVKEWVAFESDVQG